MAIDVTKEVLALSEPASVELGAFHDSNGVKLGDMTLKLSIDGTEVDSFIARLERAVAAFKSEWNKQ